MLPVDKIKVIWSCENLGDTIFLPSTAESYELKNLKNGTYRFDICAVDGEGNESLMETTYGRPLHEGTRDYVGIHERGRETLFLEK